MRMRPAAFVLAALLTACSASEEPRAPQPAPQPPQPRVDTASGGCDFPEAAERLDGGALKGDVDGDGSDDEVFVASDRDGAPGCRAFVVASTASGDLAAPTDPEHMAIDLIPQLQGLIEVNGAPGAEVVVQVLMGASTQFAALYTVQDGRLQRIRVRAEVGVLETGDLFPYGGSVGHVEASNCPPDGAADLVVSVGVPKGSRYEVKRVFLDVQGAVATEVTTATETVDPEGLTRLPEYRTSPFGACEPA